MTKPSGFTSIEVTVGGRTYTGSYSVEGAGRTAIVTVTSHDPRGQKSTQVGGAGIDTIAQTLLLELVGTPRCPQCATPLRLVDDSVRVGSGTVDNGSWQTGRLYECDAHGRFHRLGGGGLRATT